MNRRAAQADQALSPFPGSRRSWAVMFGMTTIEALFLAVIGPFGSYVGAALDERLLFQLMCFWLGTAVFGLAVRLIWASLRKPAACWAATALMVALVNIPFSLVTRTLAGALWIVTHVGIVEWYWQGLITAEPAVLLMAWLIARDARPNAAISHPTIGESPNLLGMPAEEVLCLQMEDHYIRVHGFARSHLALGTLGQAMKLMGPNDGLQVHRSWWISKHAVEGVERDGRNLRLILSNGVVAPVSRSAVPHVRAAGLLPRSDRTLDPDAAPARNS